MNIFFLLLKYAWTDFISIRIKKIFASSWLVYLQIITHVVFKCISNIISSFNTNSESCCLCHIGHLFQYKCCAKRTQQSQSFLGCSVFVQPFSTQFSNELATCQMLVPLQIVAHWTWRYTFSDQESGALCPDRVLLASSLVDRHCRLLEGALFLFHLYCVSDRSEFAHSLLDHKNHLAEELVHHVYCQDNLP